MSQRRSFLRNITLAIAASLVPRILQPAAPEVVEYDDLLSHEQYYPREYVEIYCENPVTVDMFLLKKRRGGTTIAYDWERIDKEDLEKVYKCLSADSFVIEVSGCSV